MRSIKILLWFALFGGLASAQISPGICNQQANITITASGTTTIIAADPTLNIHVCKVTFGSTAEVSVTFIGVNGGGNVNRSGAYPGVKYFAYDFGGEMTSLLGNGLGINISATATVGGWMSYYTTKNI